MLIHVPELTAKYQNALMVLNLLNILMNAAQAAQVDYHIKLLNIADRTRPDAKPIRRR